MTSDFHSLDLDKSEDGWDYACCACGWMSEAVPGADIAAELYADHILTVRGGES